MHSLSQKYRGFTWDNAAAHLHLVPQHNKYWIFTTIGRPKANSGLSVPIVYTVMPVAERE